VNQPSQSHEELFEAYLAGTISADEQVALAELLDADPAGREAFLSHLEEAHDIAMVASECRQNKQFRRRIRPSTWWAAAAAVVVAAGSLFVLLPNNDQSQADSEADGGQPPVARVTTMGRIISGTLHLADGSGTITSGELVPVGAGHAAGGIVMIEFDSGSAVALFDGTGVNLIDPSTLSLQHGRVTGQTGDQARELTVIASGLRITDLGTRFGVEQELAGATEVHVLQGTVKISQDKLEDRILPEDQALRYVAGSTLRSIPIDRDHFELTFPEPGGAPLAFVHYDFEDSSSEKFLDSGSDFDDGPFPLAPRLPSDRPSSVPGHIGRGVALRDRQALWSPFPGIAGDRSRTVAFWIKPDPLNRPMAVVSWGHSDLGREWQVGLSFDQDSGKLLARTEFGDGQVIGSHDLADGEWHHVVSTYIGGNEGSVEQLVRHYIDGEVDLAGTCGQHPINTDVNSSKARRLLVGHHLDNPTEFYFSGQLDELYIFDRALSPAEIRQLHQYNAPPPEISR